MSFNFTSHGTRDSVIQGLQEVNVAGDSLGDKVRNLLIETLEDSTASGFAGPRELEYSVVAAGHHHSGGLPSLNVVLSSTYKEVIPQATGG